MSWDGAGTEAKYYFSEAKPGNERKWLIWLQGGSLCTTEDACKQRKMDNPPLMSSSGYAETQSNEGVLGQDDPTFGGWNQAFIKYCTSDLHLGDREASDETFGLHFRGKRVVKSVLKSLQAKGLRSGDTLVLSGCSAGAMGATVLCDFVQGWLPGTISGVEVACLLDSPLPIIHDLPGFVKFVEGWSELFGIHGVLHESCLAEFPGDEVWKCVVPECEVRCSQPLYRRST